MRQNLPFILILVLAYIMSACGVGATTNPSPEPLSVKDQASLIDALQAAGATAEVGDSIIQDFFSVEGKIIKVNGADLQVFEYENAETMEKDASNVSPDGGSIGTSMVDWIDTPHFYKAGRIIALYVGSDQAILDLLNKALGPQFAGR